MPAQPEGARRHHINERIDPYAIRIQRNLASIFHDVPETRQAGQEWVLYQVAVARGYTACELCGHNPIRRLFFIRSRTTDATMCIGSECVRNYVHVDLVDAWVRTINREQRQTLEAERNEQRLSEYRERRVREQREQWEQVARDYPELITWMQEVDLSQDRSNFARDVWTRFRQQNFMTPGQARAMAQIMAERQQEAAAAAAQQAAQAEALPHTSNLETAAGPDDAAEIYNGVYTINDGGEHLTYRIHTVQRGSLQGKRIIKRQTAYGEFTGFAFVDQRGRLSLWRRFRDEANERYVVWARILLEALRSTNAMGGQASDLEWQVAGSTYQIQQTRHCRRCNRQLTTPESIDRGIGPECEARTEANRTEAANAHDVIVEGEADALRFAPGEGRERVVRFLTDPLAEAAPTGMEAAAAQAESTPLRRPATVRRAARRTPRSTTPQVTGQTNMSEVDPSWEQ